jgi:hypothetical protein
MPEQRTIERAKQKLRKGDAPSTAAGEFVREEIEHVRRGKHGARSPEQAIAIGLAKARRAGIPVAPRPGKPGGKVPRARVPKRRAPSPRRSRAAKRALEHEGRAAASHRALSRHARRVARR